MSEPSATQPPAAGARAARLPLWLHPLLLLPLAVVLVLLVQGLRGGKEDPAALVARLRAQPARTEAGPPALETGAADVASAPAPVEPEHPLARIVPAPGELPGLDAREEIGTYTAENLYDLIDGGAEPFLRLGCRGAAAADLRFATGEGITVEAFDMATAEGAAAIWKEERGPQMRDVAAGDAGYGDDAALRFRKGATYVRLLAIPVTERSGRILEELAAAIAGRIP